MLKLIVAESVESTLDAAKIILHAFQENEV
jgi:hypothetical protein